MFNNYQLKITSSKSRDDILVAQQFSRAANSYDAAAGVQKKVSQQLLMLLQQQGKLTGSWLDIGCGTGQALPCLHQQGAQQVIGLDLASGMIKQAQRYSSSTIKLLQAEAGQIPLADSSCDGVLSSLMLQWSEQPYDTLKEWSRVLKPGGLVALATLLPGTHHELKHAWRQIDNYQHVNDFTSYTELRFALQQAKIKIISQQQQCLQAQYSSLTQMLRNLKDIGATNVNPQRRTGLGGRKSLQRLDAIYPRLKIETSSSIQEEMLPLSYQVLWLLARKH